MLRTNVGAGRLAVLVVAVAVPATLNACIINGSTLMANGNSVDANVAVGGQVPLLSPSGSGSPDQGSGSPEPGSDSDVVARWSKVYGVDGLTDFAFATAKNGMATVGDGSVALTLDGGAVWTSKTLTSESLRTNDFIDDHGWVAGTRGTLFRSADSGLTWSLVDWQGAGFEDIRAVRFQNKSSGLMGTFSGFYKTEDGGLSWSKIAPFPVSRLWIVPNGNAFVVDASEYHGGLKLYSSGVLTDVEGLSPDDLYSVTFSFPDPGKPLNGWATSGSGYSSGGLNITSDGGSSWTPAGKLNLGNRFLSGYSAVGIGFSSPSDGLLLLNGSVLTTGDGGAMWEDISGQGRFESSNTLTVKKLQVLDSHHAFAWIGNSVMATQSGLWRRSP